MKHTVQGFQQDVLVEFKLDCNDALILRWILDFYHSDNMRKLQFEGRSYFWLFYKKIAQELPILNLKKRAIATHIDRFVTCGLFSKFVDSQGGNLTYFSINSAQYERLIYQKSESKQQGVSQEQQRVCRDESIEVCSPDDTPSVAETTNIYSSIKDSSIINSSIKDIGGNPSKNKFTIPILKDVIVYMFGRLPTNVSSEEEADKFMNHYNSNGWKVGNNLMANWQSAIDNWISRIGKYDKPKNNFKKKKTHLAVNETESIEEQYGF